MREGSISTKISNHVLLPRNSCKGHPQAEGIEKPDNFEEMALIASKLSKDIPHVRIDLYSVNGNIYFGEYTFFHDGGFVPFVPKKWDKILGDFIEIPNHN